MRSEQEIIEAIEEYSNMVKRICMVHLKNYADMEDIFQTVFFKYASSNRSFENKEHEKAWFIRVTINSCKDLIKNIFRKHTVSIDTVLEKEVHLDTDHKEILELVLSLDKKYKDVLYLYYYEGYSAPEIGKILHKNVNTVYTLLTRSKKLLREKMGGMFDE